MSEAAGKDTSASQASNEQRVGAVAESDEAAALAGRTVALDAKPVSVGDAMLAAQDGAEIELLSNEDDVDASDLDSEIDPGLAADDAVAAADLDEEVAVETAHADDAVTAADLDEEVAVETAHADDPTAEDDSAAALASADEIDTDIDTLALSKPASAKPVAPAGAHDGDEAAATFDEATDIEPASISDTETAIIASEPLLLDIRPPRRMRQPSISYRFEGEFQGCIAGAIAGRLQITAERAEENDDHTRLLFDGTRVEINGAAGSAEPSRDGHAAIGVFSDTAADDVEDDADGRATEIEVEIENAPRLSLFVNGHDLGPRAITNADGSFLFSLLPYREQLGLNADRDLDVSLVDTRDGRIVLSTGEQRLRWTRYATKLLNYQNETVVGFCFDTLDPDMPSFVSINVNGNQMGFGLANKVSRVLQRYAPAPAASGFAVPVGALPPGSVVTMHLPTSDINLEAFLLVPGVEPGPSVTHAFSASPGLAIRGWRARTDGGWRDKASVNVAIDGCEPYRVEANQIEAAAYRAGGSIFGGFSIRLSPSMVAAGTGEVTLTDPEEGTVLWTTRLDEQDIFIGQLTRMLDYGADENGQDGNGLSLLFFYNLNKLMTSPAHVRARKLLSRLALRALNRLIDTGSATFAANVLRTLPLEPHLPEWRLSGVALFHKLARTLPASQAESLRVAIGGPHNAKCKTSAVFTGIDLVLQTRHSGVKTHIARLLRWLQVMKFSGEAHSIVNEVVEAYARSPEEAHTLRRLVMFDMLANSLRPVTAA